MTGPFETERQAAELPAVRAVYEAFDRDPGAGKMAPHNYLMLVRACEAAGVAVGSPTSYDRRILAWLAGSRRPAQWSLGSSPALTRRAVTMRTPDPASQPSRRPTRPRRSLR